MAFFVFFISNQTVFATDDITAGLVAHYKMNDNASTTVVTDNIGSYNGTLTNSTDSYTSENSIAGVSSDTGGSHGALSFDGSNDYITTETATTLGINSASNPFSISLWFKTSFSAGDESYLYDNFNGDPPYGYLSARFEPATGAIGFSLHDGSTGNDATHTYSSGLNNGVWHHAVFVWSGITNIQNVYVDGSFVGSNTDSGLTGSLDQGSALLIATRPWTVRYGGTYFNGSIDDVRVYNRAVTAGEVSTLYGLGGGLLAHYKMNDDAASTTVLDSIGSNNGTETVNNTDILATSRINSALSFVKPTGYVTTNFQPPLGANPVTISQWFKTTDSDTGTMGNYGTYDGYSGNNYPFWGINYGENGGNLFWTTRDFYLASTGDGYNDGAWHLLTLTYDGITATMYIDGAYNNSMTTTLDVSPSPLLIGTAIWMGASGSYTGALDDMRFYDTALSSSTVASLYNSGVGTESESGSLGTGLIAHYKMNDDAASSTVVDSKGSYNGTAYSGGDPIDTNLLATSKINSALSFDGGTDYVDAGTVQDITGPITVSAWVNTLVNVNWEGVLTRNNSSTGTDNTELFGVYSDGEPQYYNPNSGGWHSFGLVNGGVGVWHHIVWVYDGTYINAYVDGVAGTPVAINPPSSAPTNHFFIGGSWSGGTGNAFKGSLDDVRIYNRALTSTDITTLYNDGLGTEDQNIGTEVDASAPASAPDAPTSVVATAGNGQASVSFSAPSDGGSTITGYTVTSDPADGTDINAGTTALSHTVTGLTNGTPYTFTVTATNAIGTSSPSSPSNEVTPVLSDISTGLVAHYKMNDDAGNTTVVDSIGSHNGTEAVNNTDILATSKINSALSFDGSNDFITTVTPTTLGIDSVSGSFSIGLWFKTTQSGGEQYLIDNFYITGGNNMISLRLDSGVLAVALYDGSVSSTHSYGSGLNDGNWHHVVALWDGSGTRQGAYIDGSFGGWNTDSLSGSFDNGYPFHIGDRPWGDGRFGGSIDDVRIYNTVLDSGAVASLYNTGLGTESEIGDLGTDLVAHYKMNDDAASSTVVDSKGGNNGTAYSGSDPIDTNLLATSKINSALSFDGSNDSINLGNPVSLQLTTGSAFAWIKTSDAGSSYRGILVKGNAYGMFLVDNIFGIHDWSSGFVTSSVNLADGKWHYVGFTFQSGVTNGTNLYIDGANVVTTTYTVQYPSSSNNIFIGANGNPGPIQLFTGSIDDARIYNRALSAADVGALYNDGLGTEDDTPITLPTLTIGKSGTQIATTTLPVTDLNLGGAFTFANNTGTSTITSITLRQAGSYPATNITNLKLYYQATSTCAGIKPSSGVTQFGTGAATFTAGYSTTTGTMSVGTGNVCLYATYNIDTDFATSSLGESVDLEISSPASDVVTSGVTVSPSTRINIPGSTVIIADNELIQTTPTTVNPACSDGKITSLLSLHVIDSTKNPTVFYLQNCSIWKMEGGANSVRLTNPNLQVQSLTFTNLTGENGAGGSIKIKMVIANVDPSAKSSILNITRTYGTTATVWGN